MKPLFILSMSVSVVWAILENIATEQPPLLTNDQAAAKAELQNANESLIILAPTRLKFVKRCIEQYPDLTMRTLIASKGSADNVQEGCNLWSLYKRDRAAILKIIKMDGIREQKVQQEIQQGINNLDNAVIKSGFFREMSFSEYNFIGRLWARMLSSPRHCRTESINRAFTEYEEDKKETNHGAIENNKFINSSGLALPQVSHTGFIPIITANRAWGFKVNENYHFMDFFAVGGQKNLSYDDKRNQTSMDSWQHDLAHFIDLSKQHGNNIIALTIARKAAFLREAAFRDNPGWVENADETKAQILLEQKQFELACFEIFHENTMSGWSNGKDLSSNIRRYKASIEQAKKQTTEILPKNHNVFDQTQFCKKVEHFIVKNIDSYYQYETDIKSAQSLGLQIGGDNFAQNVLSFFDHLEKGLAILEKYVENFNKN